MQDFTLSPGAYKYRALKKGVQGWDVYAAQTALSVTADGDFGPVTEKAVTDFQGAKALLVDGVCGIATQQALVIEIGVSVRKNYGLPIGLLFGQVRHESSFEVGNYTDPYDNGTRDLGVCQRNEIPTFALKQEVFNVPASLDALAHRVKTYHDKYTGMANRRAWELACGSWNAPAWTDALAFGKPISPEHKAQIEKYIADCTHYVHW